MNGLSEKEERDERNDRAYTQWSLLNARMTAIRLQGKPHTVHHTLGGIALIETAEGRKYELAFSGCTWRTLAALAYAPTSKKAFADARRAIRAMLRDEDGFDSIVGVRTPATTTCQKIRRMVKRDKPGFILGLPIR